jgi:surface antigen
MSASKIAAVAVLGLSLAACAGSPDWMSPEPGAGPGPKENTGTLLGAGTGAVAGAAIAGGTGGSPLAGAVVGGLLGGLIGNRIGASMDDDDKRRAYAAQMDALDRGQAGAPVSWRNPDSGRYGTVVPGPAYQNAGRNCRSFTHTIYIDGTPQTARGTACRNPDGTWQSVG